MKINWKYVLAFGFLCFVLGGLIVQSFIKPEIQTVAVGGLSFTEYLRDMFKPKFPHLFFFKGEDGKTDSFTIYADTPIGEIPIQERSGTFNIPFIVNDKPDSTWWGSWYVSYQGIGDSISINIPRKNVVLKTHKKFITFHKSLAISFNIEKCIKSELRLGLTFGDKLTLFGGLSYDSDRELNPTVGLLVEF